MTSHQSFNTNAGLSEHLSSVQQARKQIKSRLEEGSSRAAGAAGAGDGGGGSGAAAATTFRNDNMLEIDALAHKAIVELLPLISESLASTNAQIEAANAVKQIAAASGPIAAGGRGSGGGGGGGGDAAANLLGEQLDAGSRELELCSGLRQVIEELRRSSAHLYGD